MNDSSTIGPQARSRAGGRDRVDPREVVDRLRRPRRGRRRARRGGCACARTDSTPSSSRTIRNASASSVADVVPAGAGAAQQQREVLRADHRPPRPLDHARDPRRRRPRPRPRPSAGRRRELDGLRQAAAPAPRSSATLETAYQAAASAGAVVSRYGPCGTASTSPTAWSIGSNGPSARRRPVDEVAGGAVDRRPGDGHLAAAADRPDVAGGGSETAGAGRSRSVSAPTVANQAIRAELPGAARRRQAGCRRRRAELTARAVDRVEACVGPEPSPSR